MTLPPNSAQHAPLLCPRAILFDNDGVLVDSEPLHMAAWADLLKEHGLPFDPAWFHDLIGKTAPQILARLLDESRPGWDPAEFDLEALALRKNDYYLQAAKTELKAYPGVLDGLKWLRAQGIRTAVVSNAKRRELVATHEALGLAPWFDAMISRDDARAAKPDPTPYLMGAAAVGFEPGECMAVEDSPAGLASALLAKVPAIAILTHFSAASLQKAVPGRPDLQPVALFADIASFFRALH